MYPTRDISTAARPQPATAPDAQWPTEAPRPASGPPFGPDAATILASEHWSLLGFRSLIWNEAMSRTNVFLSALSAAIIALALLANTARGSHTTTLALVLLPVVLFLGIATHIRVVQINTEEIEVMLAMNRLRHAYLEIAPGLEPYFTSGHHDDAPGLSASFLLPRNPGRLMLWRYFLVNTPTVIATVDAALAAAVVVLAARQANAPATIAVVMAGAAFLLVWAALVSWERHTLDPVARTPSRFPTPPDQS
jgi:uncharacterized membrane protein